MNRNDVYWVLKEKLNNYKVVVNNRPYNKFYIPIEWESSWLITDKTFIKGFNEIYLCRDEMVIRDKYAFMQVNIKYKDIISLEIGGE